MPPPGPPNSTIRSGHDPECHHLRTPRWKRCRRNAPHEPRQHDQAENPHTSLDSSPPAPTLIQESSSHPIRRWREPDPNIGPAEGTWCCRECRFSSEPVGSLARWRGIASRGDISPFRNLRRVTRYRGFESSSLQRRVFCEPDFFDAHQARAAARSLMTTSGSPVRRATAAAASSG